MILPITLPSGFEPKIKKGDKVAAGQILAESEKSSSVAVNMALHLGVRGKKVKKYLKKNPGDAILSGEILAEKKGIFGSRTVTSKISGTVSNFEESTGTLFLLSSAATSQTIHSPVDGEVADIKEGEIELETERESVLGLLSSGEISEGEILSVGDKLDYNEITDKIRGKIVLGGTFDRDTLSKAIGMGAGGIIAKDLPEGVLENFQEKKVPTPIIKIDPSDLGKFRQGDRVIMDGTKKLIVKL
ncbi:MAG: hypothetical protein AAB801_01295 [Patescibacteria group bacterium]